MRRTLMPFLLGLSLAQSGPMAGADQATNQITVSSCPGQAIPMSFVIDCSHVKDDSTRQLCRPFIENQACRVFPAYRKITGISLQNTCQSIKFTIYDDDNWPHPKGEGGLALQCGVDYRARYSLQSQPRAKMGPYDVHELLHEYQIALWALPDAHVLFSSSMAEARKLIGETNDYNQAMENMKKEAPRLEQELRDGKIAPEKRCTAAETYIEEKLYIEDSRSVYAFYRKLGISRNPNMADRQARFNRMFYLVSGPQPAAGKFLQDYCGKF